MLKYRKDIDGLRAIAVLAVLFNHAGVKLFASGFIGVDFFFVISGFLITRIIKKDITQDNFSFRNFYYRRARRILPALYFLYFCILVLSFFLFYSDIFKEIGQSLFYSSLFTSNLYFSSLAGYFDTSSIEKPLLHTWSLSVEEQFYFIWPAFIILINRFKQIVTKKIIFNFLFILSFLMMLKLFSTNESSAFYLIQARIWQFLIGANFALFPIKKINIDSKKKNFITITSLILLIASTMIFSRNTPIIVYSLFCIFIVVLIILGDDESLISHRFLTHDFLVFTGKISYSLYLWHWFILVIFWYHTLEFTVLHQVLAIVLSYLIATFSWKYIETPLRNYSNDPKEQKKTLINFSFLIIIFSLVGYLIKANDGLHKFKTNKKLQQQIKNKSTSYLKRISCNNHVPKEFKNKKCQIGVYLLN